MYDIYNIANFSFAYIFKSYLSLYEKKEMKKMCLEDEKGDNHYSEQAILMAV